MPTSTTQLNSTELNSTAWTTVDSVCRSWRHKQKHDWLGRTLFNWVSWVQLSSVELCRYKHPFCFAPVACVFDRLVAWLLSCHFEWLWLSDLAKMRNIQCHEASRAVSLRQLSFLLIKTNNTKTDISQIFLFWSV